ncbi:hypothetical protein FQN49_005888, partial [Arthroderma sp. PD_2]
MVSTTSRPRRSVTRKSFIIEESSDEEVESGRVTPTIPSNDEDDDEDEEEDYTPVPKRRASRRVSRAP